MKNLLLKLLWYFLGHSAKVQALRQAKRQATIAYLKVLQGSRLALVGLLLAIGVFQLMLLSLVITIVCGVWLLSLDTETKLWILFGIFGSFFTIPTLLFIFIFKESTWYKASGAEKIVEDLRKSA